MGDLERNMDKGRNFRGAKAKQNVPGDEKEVLET